MLRLSNAEIELRGSAAWAGARAELVVRRCQHPVTDVVFEHESHTLFLHLEGASRRADVEIGEHRVRRRRNSLGRVSIIPAGTRLTGTIAYPARITYLSLFLSPEFSVDPGASAIGALTPAFGVDDPGLVALLRLLASEIASPGPQSDVYCRGLVAAAAVHLSRHYRNSGQPAVVDLDAGLSPAALRRVLEIIDARLGEPLCVAMLAEEAGLCPAYFARRFKHSVGMPPYRYVVERRLALAAQLLTCSAISVKDLAARLGFATPAHFAFRFRQRFGTAPTRWQPPGEPRSG